MLPRGRGKLLRVSALAAYKYAQKDHDSGKDMSFSTAVEDNIADC